MDRTRLDCLKAQRSKFIMSFNSHVGTYSQNLFKFLLAQHAVTPNRLAFFFGSELPWTKARFETIPLKHLGKEHDYPWEKNLDNELVVLYCGGKNAFQVIETICLWTGDTATECKCRDLQ